MFLQFLQDFIGLVCFEPGFVLVHPRFLFLLGVHDGFAGCTEVVAYMKEINQVAALCAKLIFYLIYPGLWQRAGQHRSRSLRAVVGVSSLGY